MEKRINNKITQHFTGFKEGIKERISQFNIGDDDKMEFLEFLYSYPHITVDKCDFQKRKRVKNVVPLFNRCCAKRADERQCTRRRKPDELYCGTHSKSRPHGTVDDVEQEKKDSKVKHQVWAQDIKGIIYYIDKNQNVYDPEDILKSTVNPKIIAKTSDKYFRGVVKLISAN